MVTRCKHRQVLSLVSIWSKERGLSVNLTKTEMALFLKKYKLPPFKALLLNEVELTLPTVVKYIGVILEEKVERKRNIEVRSKKAIRALYDGNKTTYVHIVHWI